MGLGKTTVEINQQVVTVETDIDPLEMQSIAKYVEEKINEVKNASTEQTSSKIMILACLNIAGELFRQKANFDNLSYSVNKKADEMLARMDSALDSRA